MFGGFSSDELATRIDDSEPKVVVSASCGIEGNLMKFPKNFLRNFLGKKQILYKPLLDQAIEISKFKPQNVIIYQVFFGDKIHIY